MAEQVRVRRDIWSLEGEQSWHPITRAYALAIGAMKERDAGDPTSLEYQAQIHGMPDFGQPDRFRGQCQHRCWFFLPWHRLYLHWFEQIVLAEVRANDDVDEETKAAWALPYWNYSEQGRASLPPAFREPESFDGEVNPLFVPVRNQAVNDGVELEDFDTDIWKAMQEAVFSRPRPEGGFGGAATGFNHLDQDVNRFTGKVEATPHNSVHGAVGGHMLGFATAGLDPVFWLHHANIDRLWVVWLGQQDRENPDPGGSWGTTVSHFHDAAKDPVQGSASEVLDTVADLGYQYEDTTLPAPPPRRRRTRVPSEPPPDHPPELVGATEEAVELTGGTTRVAVPVGEPTGPARRRGRGGDPERVYLTVEGIEGDENPGFNYAVLLNLPDDADPDEEPEVYYAGTVSFFGIEQTRRTEAAEGGHGLAQSFDISDLVAQQREADTWDPEQMTVTFAPIRPGASRRRGGRDTEREGPPVKLGRVGVYYQ
jgi:tyrosinase